MKSAEGPMRLAMPVLPWLLVAYLLASLPSHLVAQGSYRAQLRGVVSDATGAVIPNATVTITNTGTNISSAAHTDERGAYYFTGLLPSTYSVKAQASGFRMVERTDVVLAVDQEATLNFTMTRLQRESRGHDLRPTVGYGEFDAGHRRH